MRKGDLTVDEARSMGVKILSLAEAEPEFWHYDPELQAWFFDHAKWEQKTKLKEWPHAYRPK